MLRMDLQDRRRGGKPKRMFIDMVKEEVEEKDGDG